MYQVVLLLHVFIAVCIVALVLVQQGKGASMGAAFGSGASQTVFGSRGSGSFLFRFTIGFVIAFFITSIALNYLAMQAYKQQKIITLPAQPVKQIPVQNLPDQIPQVPVPKKLQIETQPSKQTTPNKKN